MPDYPSTALARSQHTIRNVFQIIENSSVNLPINWTAPDGIRTASDVFVGYLLLDAWIANSDRHHENWAFIRLGEQNYLAPTYDHASSLGRNEKDEKRLARLTTKDAGFSVRAYVEKCKSCLYAEVGDRQPLKTYDAFRRAAQLCPEAACIWVERLAMVSATNTLELFQRIPSSRISSTAIDFARRILEINRQKLLEL